MFLVEPESGRAEVPLQEVKIKGHVYGLVGKFTVTQVYTHREQGNIEVVYTFPLPDKAIVSGFKARVGERQVASEIWDRDEAFALYDQAVRKGDTAFLLEQYRPNIFQVSLGQLQPGDEVEIALDYLRELEVTDRELHISIPTVVAPRYIPGVQRGKRRGLGVSPPTDRVPDADFISPPVSDPDYKVELDLTIKPLLPVSEYISPSHEIIVQTTKEHETKIRLASKKCTLDRDIVIIGFCQEESRACGFLYKKKENHEGFIYLNFIPEFNTVEEPEGRDYIFLIDISGSMEGEKLTQAKNALNLCLRNLTDGDTFNIVAFESSCHYFSRRGSVPFNQANLDKATRWIKKLEALGGTEIFEAIRYALNESNPKGSSLLLLTDGQVGNEREIFAFVQQRIENNGIFTFGIDTAVNSFFINGLADIGHGKSELIRPGERIEEKVLRQFARISSPTVEDAWIDWGGLEVKEVVPQQISRLFNLEPLAVTARFSGDLKNNISLRGKVKGDEFNVPIDLASIDTGKGFEYLEKFWAYKQIEYLEATLTRINPRREEAVIKEIKRLSKEYGINSSYTAFVAVQEREDKAAGWPETVVIPVSPPSKWAMFQEPRLPTVTSNLFYESYALGENTSPLVYQNSAVHPASHEAVQVEENREDQILRKLALKQQADGSFAGNDKDDYWQKVEDTAVSLMAFVLSKRPVSIYRRQLEKAVKYLLNAIKDTKPHVDEERLFNVYLKTIFALEASALAGILGGRVKRIINQEIKVAQDYLDALEVESKRYELARACLEEKARKLLLAQESPCS